MNLGDMLTIMGVILAAFGAVLLIPEFNPKLFVLMYDGKGEKRWKFRPFHTPPSIVAIDPVSSKTLLERRYKKRLTKAVPLLAVGFGLQIVGVILN